MLSTNVACLFISPSSSLVSSAHGRLNKLGSIDGIDLGKIVYDE
jgi:hypothetical protein